MTEYKNRKSVQLRYTRTIEQDGIAHSLLSCDAHSGTHIDAPAHVIVGGATVDQLPLEAFTGPCQVLDLTHVQDAITVDVLSSYTLKAGSFVLFKTRNSALPAEAAFVYDFVYLTSQAAQYLVNCNIKGVGIDYLGIERDQPEHPTHKILLSNGLTLIEGLRLAHIAAGNYTLFCLPLCIKGAEAAPARAVLL